MTIFRDRMGRTLTKAQVMDKSKVRLFNIILDFEIMILRWAGHIPFHTVRILIYTLAGVKLGQGSVIHMWCNFFNPKGVQIGDDSIIGDHAFLDGRANLYIGSHVAIASQVLIYNSQHDIEDPDFMAVEKPVQIEDYVFIGPRVIILPGVRIGKGAVVAAGAVVSRDVAPYTVVGGVPAEFIRNRSNKKLSYRLGRARLFQ